MKAFLIIVLMLFELNLFCGEFPKELSTIGNWECQPEKQFYGQNNLYDYIDGASDFYLSYLFQDLWVVDYQNNEGGKLTLELYRHKDEKCAFGIYVEERPSDAAISPIGVEGYITSDAFYFLKGSYYVKIFIQSETVSNEDLMSFSMDASKLLNGNSQFPNELTFFPPTGKIEGSERYVAENFLGQDELDDFFTCSYNNEGEEYKIFVSELNAELSKEIINRYLSDNPKYKELNPGVYLVDDKYNGSVLIAIQNQGIIGITGYSKPQKFLDQLMLK